MLLPDLENFDIMKVLSYNNNLFLKYHPHTAANLFKYAEVP